MKKDWKKRQLGEVLELEIDAVPVDPAETYLFAGVYGFGRGLFFRGEVKGTDTTYARFHRLHAGQLVMSQPKGWEGAIAVVSHEFEGRFLSSVFPTFRPITGKLSPEFLRVLTKCPWLWDALLEKSVGIGARRNSIYPAQLLEIEVPLPSVAEQERIVAHLDAVENRLARVQKLRVEQLVELDAALASAFHKLESKADWVEMAEVAPIHRRPTELNPEGKYPELGARSFGKGIFHKPTLSGESLTWQKLFQVHEGDIVISNIKAWEGAIAVAGKADHGRFGSHRYLTCVTDLKKALPEYICFYLLTNSGLEQVGKASPGSADRNRTLAVGRLQKIKVPIVPIEAQCEFKKLLDFKKNLQRESLKVNNKFASLLPSLLDRIFKH